MNAAPDQRSARLVNYYDDEDTTRQVVYTSNNELKDISVEGSGLTLATPELDSAMGVGSQIDPSKEVEDEADDVYRQLKEMLDEPVASGSKGESSKPKPKVGMRPGVMRGSNSRIGNSRVYSYYELKEYQPRRDDSNDDSFRFNIEDTKMEF